MEIQNLRAKKSTEQRLQDWHLELEQEREEMELLRQKEELQQRKDELRFRQHERELENEKKKAEADKEQRRMEIQLTKKVLEHLVLRQTNCKMWDQDAI